MASNGTAAHRWHGAGRDDRARPAWWPLPFALALAACGTERAPEATTADAPTPPAATALPPEDAVPAVLDRRGIIEALRLAASEHSSGRAAPASDALVDRSFALRIAFACPGSAPLPADGAGTAGLPHWSRTADGSAIRLTLSPADWIGASAPVDVGDAGVFDAVEGYWLPRPWQGFDDCPVARSGAAAAPPASPAAVPAPSVAAAAPAATSEPPAAQTMGLAAVYAQGSSRIGRRNGRPYASTIEIGTDGTAPPPGGYRLVLEGRVAAFPGGGAIACRGRGAERPPVCVIAVRLDRVAFESGDGAALDEWRAD